VQVVETAKEAVRKKLDVIVGYLTSSQALIASTYLKNHKIPLVLPTATSNALDNINPRQIRTCVSNRDQALALVNYLKPKKKIQKIAVISMNQCAYCMDLANAFMDSSDKKSLPIYLLGKEVETISLQKLKDFQPDAIFITTHEIMAARIYNYLYDNNVRAKLWIGGDGWSNEQIVLSKMVAPRNFEAISLSHWQRSSSHPNSKAFVKAYKELHGMPPKGSSGLFYEAFTYLFDSLIEYKSENKEWDVYSALNSKLTFP
tara:strand:- start:29 stop:805 length:777 start_codon:yes stop_codon:yes gene_type:complete